MKDKRDKKELTRLILTALILGGGSLYGPIAEATVTVTGTPDNLPSGSGLTKSSDIVYANSNSTQWTLNYGAGDAWNNYSIFGGYLITGSSNLSDYTITLANSGNSTIEKLMGAYGNSSTTTTNVYSSNVYMTGGKAKIIIGGYSYKGRAGKADDSDTGNTVTINGGTVEGFIDSDISSETTGVIGGCAGLVAGSSGTAGAFYNQVTISPTAATSITGNVYGGYSGQNNANNNKVTIENPNSKSLTFTNSTIYGGVAKKSGQSANDNIININTGVSVAGIVGGDATNSSGNVLNIGATGITVGASGISKTQTINIGYTGHSVAFADTTTPVLSSTGAITDVDTLDITGMTIDSNKYGTMTLVSASNSLAYMKLKYSTAAAAATIPTAGVKVNSDTDVHNSSVNNINFAYTYDHMLKWANADKKAIQYNIANNVSAVTVNGTYAWNNGGIIRSLSDDTYLFNVNTSINASNLAFSNTMLDYNPLGQSMTLLSKAKGITGSNITQPTYTSSKGTVNTSYTEQGVAFTGTATGEVSVVDNETAGYKDVKYTLNSGTLNNINLNTWNGNGITLDSRWSSGIGDNSIEANFTFEPENDVTDILTTNTTGFFNDDQIYGNKKYSGGTTLVDSTKNGVTFTGYQGGGVKATDNGKKLTLFKQMMDTRSITFGDMTWGTGRGAGTGDNFALLGSINATNLKFTNPLAVGTTMTLLSNATDLQAGTAVTGSSHTQNFTNQAADNGVKLNGTIEGTVSTAIAGQVDYTVTDKSITGADLSGWDSTKNAYSLAGWTKGFTAGSINAAGFTAPDVKAGQSKDILTASNGFFSDEYITGAQKYDESVKTTTSDSDAGVTFTGEQSKGVKASTDGTKLQYVAGNMAVSDITLGNMTVGAGGVVNQRTADANYTFNGSTTINATNLTFDKPADVADSTLVSNATNITSSNPVTGASHSQAITNAAMGTGGITVSGTLNGTVSAVDGGVDYTVNNKTVSSMDLSGWDTNTEGTTLPDTDWTGSNVTVNANSFAADAPTADKTIFTTTQDNFFGNVTGTLAYKSGAAFSGDVDAGVTLSGTKSGGVKTDNAGRDLKFIAELKTVNNIALGNMDWGTGRTITGNYDFSTLGASGIDASKLSFTGFDVNTIKATDTMTLLTDAKGLGTGLVAPVSPSQSLSYTVNNVATLSGTLTGTVSTEAVDAQTSKVIYTVDKKTLDSVDISNWDGATNENLDASWTKNDSGIKVTGSGFTKPTDIGDTSILKAGNGFFTDAQIADNIKYQQSGSYSETEKNVTLSGTRGSGVKAIDNDSKLVYSIGAAFINNIKLGTVTYNTTAPWITKNDPTKYNFSNLSSLDTTSFVMSMSDADKKAARATDAYTMTLVKGTDDLPDIAAKDAGSSNYSYTATSGLTVGGTVSGSVSASNHDVLYKVTGNKATNLDFTNVAWNSTYNRSDSELDYKPAVVDSSNIFFSGVTTLSTGAVMTLISNYGSGINKTRGGIFTIKDENDNILKGKGTAYYDGGELKYKVTLGAGETQQTVTATNNKAILIIPDGQEHQGTVTGGEAKGDGDSTDNEQGVKGKIITNTDGTGGDVNGGTSEEGDSRRNKATVEDSTIEGDVNGGKSENGNSTDNEAEVDHSNVGGDVNGGKTDGDGETKGNEANVKNGSKVTGSVTGGHSGGNGDCTGNAAEVEGSEVGGDVNGGQSDGDGNTRENKTHVKDSKVTGNVIGGHSGQNDGSGGNGESTGNTAEVEGSEVGGNVNGGRSEQGNANKNESTVSGGSKVTGDVTGGSSGGGGTANENKTTVEGGSHIGGNVTGGESNGGNTNKNETTVSGSTVDKDVIGGKTSGNGTSNENKTNVNGSKVGGNVIGGQSENGNAEKNETTISGGSTVGGDVIGGKTTGTGNANENKVTLDGGSTVNGNIYGGYSENGDASGNDVNIGIGKINGNIYGGFGSGNTTNNTITLSSGADVSNSNIFGGSNGSAGNTLNIGTSTEAWSGGGQSVKNISNFETLNFSSVPWNNSNAALNISDGSASDLSMTTIQAPQVSFSGVKRLSSGSTMMLLNQSNVTPATNKATNLVAGSAFTLGTAMEGSGRLTLDADGNVVYLVENASVSEQTHNTVMAAEAAVLSINSGNDFINSATEGLAQKENVGTDGLATYAKIGGQSMKQDTGSHVKLNTWNAILALGHKNTKKQSAFEYGAFVEHGWGNFATHNNGLRGDGSAEYTGGGLLAKWKTNNGTYVEGSFRAGTVNEKANNLLRDAVQAYGYDERTSYAGFHIGVGKETVLKNGNLVDVYGKYFYNRKNGMNFNAGFDEYNIDAVTSQILRVGARYTVKSGSRWNYYGDLSYEHEFDGKATGRVNDMAIRGADISGGSLRMELGASLTPNDESPWEVDFNLTAYAGNKSGFTGGVSVKYAF